MEEEWKVYIKGVPNRGDEIIKILTNLGANNDYNYDGYASNYFIYFINHEGNISSASINSEPAKIIMDNYREIKLPEKWKDGDLLVCHMLSGNRYAVYSNDSELMKYNTIITYANVDNHTYGVNVLFDKEDFTLASDEEHKEFYDLLHKHGVDWNAEKKQLVNWKWKPKDSENYWTIIVGITIYKLKLTWIGSEADKIRYELGNCFRTSDEADAMLKKVKLLFNKE